MPSPNVIHPETPPSSVGNRGGQVSVEDFSNFQQTVLDANEEAAEKMRVQVDVNKAILSAFNADKKLTEIQLARHTQEMKLQSERIHNHDKEFEAMMTRIDAGTKLTNMQIENLSGEVSRNTQQLTVQKERIDGHDKQLEEVTKSTRKASAKLDFALDFICSKFNLDSPASANTKIGK